MFYNEHAAPRSNPRHTYVPLAMAVDASMKNLHAVRQSVKIIVGKLIRYLQQAANNWLFELYKYFSREIFDYGKQHI